MNKLLSLAILVGLLGSACVRADGDEPMTYEITVKVIVNPTNNPAEQTVCDDLALNLYSVAQECSDCTTKNFDGFLDNLCSCIKEMGAVLKNCDCTEGNVVVSIKDPEGRGVGGLVRKK